MPYFPPPLATPLALYSDDIGHMANAAAVVAGSAYLSEVYLNVPFTVAQMRAVFNGTPAGICDMGIYDSQGTNGQPLNLLGHTGAINATIGAFTQNLTSSLLLVPGTYWIAFLDTVADSVYSRSSGAGAGMIVAYKTTATNLTVLPSTIGAIADNQVRIAVMALRSNGFS